MKTTLFIIILFLSNLTAQQYYYTFSELKGMEDGNNDTHLFYRLYTFQKGGSIIGDYFENSIHHFDLENETDTVFLFDGGRIGESVNSVIDLDFWNADPSKFIYLGVGVSVDPVYYIKRFDEESSFWVLGTGLGTNIGISKQNDSLVFALNFKKH